MSAQVQRQPGHVDAWRLLGTVHAENDDDTQAIAAMGQALRADPTNAEVCYLLLLPVQPAVLLFQWKSGV